MKAKVERKKSILSTGLFSRLGLFIALPMMILLAASCRLQPLGGAIAGGNTVAHTDSILPVLLSLTVILLAAKAAGELFGRMGQPAVLGELLAGVVLGNLVLINPEWGFFHPLRVDPLNENWAIVVDGFARIGVILLLFEVGLESSIAEMRSVGLSALLVAMVGVIVPFFLGYGVSSMFIREVPPALLKVSPAFDISNIHLFVGAALCATSVGITARVFRDFGKLKLPEARIVLGAAVIDDVLGLLILAVVSGIVVSAETGKALSIGLLLQLSGTAVGFLAGALVMGLAVVPRLLSSISNMRTPGVMIVAAIVFCFALSYLANLAGLATIVGAFAAGLILEEVHFKDFRERRSLRELLQPVTTLLVPVFFVLMGIQVHLETFGDFRVVGIALALSAAAFLGKQVCGLAVVEKGLDRLTVGLGMVPRGEVGLIFASIGKSLRIIDDSIFSAIVIVVILTTVLTPPLLKISLGRVDRKRKNHPDI